MQAKAAPSAEHEGLVSVTTDAGDLDDNVKRSRGTGFERAGSISIYATWTRVPWNKVCDLSCLSMLIRRKISVGAGILQRECRAPQYLTSVFARLSLCTRSFFPMASSRRANSVDFCCICSLDDAFSALAAANLCDASVFSAAAVASISVALARAALTAAVAAAEAPSAAESEAAWRQSRFHPRNKRVLSASLPKRAILTEA